jgi:peptidoglycan hydrolase-like protein with peptidoglycan-binding domain
MLRSLGNQLPAPPTKVKDKKEDKMGLRIVDRKFASAVAIAGAVSLVSVPAWATGDPQQERAAQYQTERQADQEMYQQLSAEDIREVQEALRDEGHDPGPIDGIWGPETQAAVKDFQQANDLQVTGQLDKQTMEELGVNEGIMERIAQVFERNDQRERPAAANGEMHEGLTSEDIRQVQEKLQEEGHNPGPIDGNWGPQTQAAVEEFQREQDLQVTGKLDRQTLEELGVDEEIVERAGEPRNDQS